MEFIEKFLSEYWQYVTLVIGAGFVMFGLRIVYILLGIGTVLYSLFCIFS